MAVGNVIYPLTLTKLGRQTFVDWVTADFRSILVDTGLYTYSAAHDFLDDVASGARVAVSGTLQNKTMGGTAGGVGDCDDVVWNNVTGASAEAVILYHHTGTESTSELFMFMDDATGLPVVPNTGNITLTFDNTPGVLVFAL